MTNTANLTTIARMGGLDAMVGRNVVVRADASGRKHKIAHPKPSRLAQPVLQRRVDDRASGEVSVWAVRLLHEVTEGTGMYNGKPLTAVYEEWLDGRWTRDTYGDGRIIKHEEDSTDMAAVSAARTKDTLDFGRFTEACTAVVRAVDAAGPNMTAEQEESILQSYQRLLAWREMLATKVLEMDGALDVAAAKVRQAVQ